MELAVGMAEAVEEMRGLEGLGAVMAGRCCGRGLSSNPIADKVCEWTR